MTNLVDGLVIPVRVDVRQAGGDAVVFAHKHGLRDGQDKLFVDTAIA